MPVYIVSVGKDGLMSEMGEWACEEDAKSDFIENNGELFEQYEYNNRGETRQDYYPEDIVVEEYVDDTL